LLTKKGLISLALFVCLIPTTSFSFDTKLLSEERYWQQLLHFKNGQSEIDSSNFFLASNGKIDAKAELEATLSALHNNEDITCRFPARIKWLYETIPELSNKIDYKKCQSLEELLETYQASNAVLVFPTAHINSPASMFGHSFLRIDDKSGLSLTANAINYAAETTETNGFLFAYQGLFGGYNGKYSALPYYKKIKEYSDLERRDIWEYDLNLNQHELTRLLTHLYELKDTYADYFFLTENCSYNLLWLLEIARADTDLVSLFHFKAIPIDTIKAINQAGFIEGTSFRPSKTKQIKNLVKQEENATGDLKKAYKAELDIERLKLNRTKNKIDKNAYIKELLAKLSVRSKLPMLPEAKIAVPSDPLLSHKTAKITAGYNTKEDLEFGVKFSFHDIYDLEKGFISGAYINFFNLQLYKSKGDKIKLKDLDLLSINSYAVRDDIFKPISWGVSIGTKEFRQENHFKLTSEVGLSYALGKEAFSFLMLKPSLFYKNQTILGLGVKAGFIANHDNYKFGIIGENSFFNEGQNNINIEAFSTIKITKNTAINLKVNTLEAGKETYTFSMFYYL